MKRKTVVIGALVLILSAIVGAYLFTRPNRANLSFEACVLSIDGPWITVFKVSEEEADRLCIVECNSSSTPTKLLDAQGSPLSLSDFGPGEIVRCEVDSLIQYLSPAVYFTTYKVVKTGTVSEELLAEGKKLLPGR